MDSDRMFQFLQAYNVSLWNLVYQDSIPEQEFHLDLLTVIEINGI